MNGRPYVPTFRPTRSRSLRDIRLAIARRGLKAGAAGPGAASGATACQPLTLAYRNVR
jgi:hypothetical protein